MSIAMVATQEGVRWGLVAAWLKEADFDDVLAQLPTATATETLTARAKAQQLRADAKDLRERDLALIARLEALATRRPSEAAGLHVAAGVLREELGNGR